MTAPLEATVRPLETRSGYDEASPYAGRTPQALRICMPTSRRYLRPAFYGASYEAQDVLASTADVDLIHLEAGRSFRWREPLLRKLVWKDVSRRLVFSNPGLRPVQVVKDYDLFLTYCASFRDLLQLNALKDWRRRCGTSVCFLQEVWAKDVNNARPYLRALDRFDHIVLGQQGSTQAVSEVLKRPCHFVPPAADVLRFTPYPHPPARVVDVYSIGRRVDTVHDEIVKLAAKDRRFYVYDTLQDGGDSVVKDHREHRDLVAGLAKRSHCFMVAAAKVNSISETKGQVEIPNRYYEGSAAGAALVGQRLDSDEFRRAFYWPDAVIEVRQDGSDTVEVLSSLLRDTRRLKAISSRNAEEALLHYDWVYRWLRILAIAGFPPTPGMVARVDRLRQLADMARRDRDPRDGHF